jgi:CheY-like chemotaxis protein
MNIAPVLFYIDDDNDDLDIFREAVSELGASVHLFSDPYKLEYALDNPPPVPSIVFVDLNMPVKSGYQIINEMKTSERLKEIPIVILSTADDSHNIEKSRASGANYYICKPTSFDKLKNVIAQTLEINWKQFDSSGNAFVHK